MFPCIIIYSFICFLVWLFSPRMAGLACNNLQPAPAPMINASKRSLTPHHDWWQIGSFNCCKRNGESGVLWFSLNFQRLSNSSHCVIHWLTFGWKRGTRVEKEVSFSLVVGLFPDSCADRFSIKSPRGYINFISRPRCLWLSYNLFTFLSFCIVRVLNHIAFYATFNDFLITEATTGWAEILWRPEFEWEVNKLVRSYITHFGGLKCIKPSASLNEV